MKKTKKMGVVVMKASSIFTAVTLAFVLGLAGFGCKGKSDSKGAGKKADKAGKVGACNRIKDRSQCIQYRNENFDASGEKHLRDICKAMDGKFKLGPCPADKRVGTCATPEGTKVTYSVGGSPKTAVEAQKQCKEGLPVGKWKAAK